MDYADPTWAAEVEWCFRSGRQPRAAQASGNVECEPGWSWAPTLTDYDLWLARSGFGTAVINGRRHPISPHTALLLRPGDHVVMRQDLRRRLRVVYCHFTFGVSTPAMSEGLLPARLVQTSAASGLETALLTAVRAAQAEQAFSRLTTDLSLCQAVLAYYREDAAGSGHPVVSPDGRIQSVVDLIRSNPGRRYTLGDAARLARLSPSHFSLLFRQEVGDTFRGFVLTTRLDRAARLLTDTPMSVAEISKALGYTDAHLFSRQFSARFGLPPSAVRSAKSPQITD